MEKIRMYLADDFVYPFVDEEEKYKAYTEQREPIPKGYYLKMSLVSDSLITYEQVKNLRKIVVDNMFFNVEFKKERKKRNEEI